MADRAIGELPAASELYDDSLLVIEQQNEARSIRGELLRAYAEAAAKGQADAAAKSAEAAKTDAARAAEKAKDAADVALYPPKIQGGHWWIWDAETGAYADSGVDAGVSLTIEETVTGAPGEPAKVENVGTATDPKLRFTIPLGDQGPVSSVNGQNGAVTVTPGSIGAYTKAETDAKLSAAAGDINYFVDVAAGSNVTGDGSEANPFQTISAAVSRLPKNMNGHSYSVTVAPGTYDEEVNIQGFYGPVWIYPNQGLVLRARDNANRPVVTKQMNLYANAVPVTVSGFDSTAATLAVRVIMHNGPLTLTGIHSTAAATSGISIECAQVATFYNCELSNKQTALQLVGCMATVYGLSGTGNTTCCQVGSANGGKGAMCLITGSTITGTTKYVKQMASAVIEGGALV